MNRWFAESPDHFRSLIRSGSCAFFILLVQDEHELIPRQFGMRIREEHRVETMVPTPDRVHPILRHQHGWPRQIPLRPDNRRPIDVRCQISGVLKSAGTLGMEFNQLRYSDSSFETASENDSLIAPGSPTTPKLFDKGLDILVVFSGKQIQRENRGRGPGPGLRESRPADGSGNHELDILLRDCLAQSVTCF